MTFLRVNVELLQNVRDKYTFILGWSALISSLHHRETLILLQRDIESNRMVLGEEWQESALEVVTSCTVIYGDS